MIHVTIGLIVGIIMGLTGAGGALISIPLFMHLIHTSLREATVLSLIAVLLGTFINLIGQFQRIDKKIVLYFSLFGGIANYLTLPLKDNIPEIYIAIILALIGAYSVWNVWRPKRDHNNSLQSKNSLKLIATGLLLGLITTLTGLGGGVILVPILIGSFNKTYDEALPTSLGTIFLISAMSLGLQFETSAKLVTMPEVLLLTLGAVFAFVILKVLIKKLTPERTGVLRKVVFTAVTLYSIGTVFVKMS